MKPKTNHTKRQIPRLAQAGAMGIETLQIMKTKLAFLKLAILLCATFVTSVALGQNNIWTNVFTDANSMNLGVHTNVTGPYVSGGLGSGTTLEFNGGVPGPMVVYQNDGIDHNTGNLVGGSAGANGVTFEIDSAQTSPVKISTTASPASVNMGFNTFTVQLGAGQLTLGDNTANVLATVGRPSGATHDMVNQSANPVIICPNFEWQNGGGFGHDAGLRQSNRSPGKRSRGLMESPTT